MRWPRMFVTVMAAGFILITVAIQTEKPAVQLSELRASRLAAHFREVEFIPDTYSAWAVGFNGCALRTDDAGKTWVRTNTGTNARLYGLHVRDKHSVYCCGSDGTLLASYNAGRTWKHLKVPTRYRLLDVFFTSSETGWVVGDNGCILRTRDGGKNWSPVHTGIKSGFRRIWFSSDGNGLVAGYEGVLLHSGDNGETWVRMDLPEHISFYGISGRDGGGCFLVGSCGLMAESGDYGESWTMLPVVTTSFLREIAFDSDGYGCAAGYGVILCRTPDSADWRKCADLPGINLQSISFGSNGYGIAVGQWGAVLLTEDHGQTWLMQKELFAPDLLDISADRQSGTIMASGADGWVMVKQADSDVWDVSNTGLRCALTQCASDQKGRFWTSGTNTATLQRLEPPDGWKRIGLPVEGSINDLVFIGDSRGFLVGDHGLMLVTGDSGDTWQLKTPPIQKNIQGIVFTDNTCGYLFGDEGLIMESVDGGSTWMAHDTGVTSDFKIGWFGSNGHALVVSDRIALESISNGHNSSWFETQFSEHVTAIANGGRYLGLANGDILDRRTGIARCTNGDPILAFESNSKGNEIWGAGVYGRITSLKTNDINLLLTSRSRE